MDSLKSRLDGALASWRQWRVDLESPPRVLCALLGGRTNRSWLIESSSGRGVLRLDSLASEHMGIDRGREAVVMRALDHKPYVPPLWFQNPVSGVQVTGFVSGRVYDQHTLPHEHRENLAEVVRDYQGVTLPPLSPMNYYDYLQRYWQRCKKDGRAMNAWHDEWRDFLPRLKRLQESDWRPMLCHHDLEGRNIIVDGQQLTLIDWEYAHLGHPHFDLGSSGFSEPLSDTDTQTLAEMKFWMTRLWQAIRQEK